MYNNIIKINNNYNINEFVKKKQIIDVIFYKK